MTEERDRVGRDTRAEALTSADPTLGPLQDAGVEADGLSVNESFPDPTEGERLVLFQREDGAIELQWRIDPVSVEHARAAFSTAADPHARLLLKGLGSGDGAVATADLDAMERLAEGVARYDAPATEGPLQAEIGLGDAGGGWILIARSNRLEAIGPVGAAFLRDAPAESQGRAEPKDSESATVATIDAKPASTLPGLAPEFPLVAPPSGPARGPRGVPEVAGRSADRGQATTLDSARPLANGVGEAAPPIQGSISAPDQGQARDDIVTDRSAVIAQSNGLHEDGAWIMSPADGAGSGTLAAVTAERPSAATPIPQGPADGADESGDRVQARRGSTAGGSGPILPPRPDQGVELGAELVVHGSAPPGRLLVLGGHRYRVGPGGRFLLRVPVTDAKLIEAALGQLDQLPVTAREPDDDAVPPSG